MTGALVCQEGEGLIPPLWPSCISLTMVQMAIASFLQKFDDVLSSGD